MKTIAFTLVLLLLTPHARAEPQTLRELYGLAAIDSLSRKGTALVLVDFQHEFFDGHLPLPGAVRAARSAAALLAWARSSGVRVVHVTNIAAKPDSPIFRSGSPQANVFEPLAPVSGEQVFVKPGGGAFTDTQLEPWLHEQGIDTVVITGLMTHLAVYLSATDASTRGFRVIVASDATASRALPSPDGAKPVGHRVIERAALAALADRFADILTSRRITALPLRD